MIEKSGVLARKISRIHNVWQEADAIGTNEIPNSLNREVSNIQANSCLGRLWRPFREKSMHRAGYGTLMGSHIARAVNGQYDVAVIVRS
jgi:hypothetical protein